MRKKIEREEPKEELWALEDHVCRKNCGGRIMRRAAGPSIATGGGNEIYCCSQCGAGAADINGYQALCWCGFSYHGQDYNHPYMCLPFSKVKEDPRYREMFLRCGSDPDDSRGLIGIVLVDDLRKM